MEADKNPVYLRGLREQVETFRSLFVQFVALHVENTGVRSVARGIAPALWVREGADKARTDELHSLLSLASGRAAAAADITDTRYVIEGVPFPVNPIENWDTVLQPKPLLEAVNVLSSCDRIMGKLDALIAKAEAETPQPIGVQAFHPLVWGAANRLWNGGHFRQAVTAAAEALVGNVKALTERNDLPETSLWQQTFSKEQPEPGKPRLRWPGDPKHRDVMAMNDGLRQFAPGVQMTIRNAAAHGTGEMSEQDAIERLAVLSLLARWVDECELIPA